jgi:peptidoglycan/xylan/chitin deacetylase (PgdA/CDA1 family)
MPFTPLRQGCAAIFMLHRFRDAETGTDGHDPAELRRILEYLRRRRYDLVSLSEMFQRLRDESRSLHCPVAFTMDDGYYDQAAIGAAIFAEYDCPVTTFVITGFLDRRLWLWWDRISYAFDQTQRRQLHVRLDGQGVEYRWADPVGRRRAERDFIERCKSVPGDVQEAGIRALSHEAEVDLPVLPPDRYRPMSWEDVRRCERRGMSFGPHTVTHPILSRAASVDAHREIVDSWTRLCAEARGPVPVFCYPNGRRGDFGAREIHVLRARGFAGGLSSETGYADSASFRRDEDGPFTVRRFAYPDSLPHLVQIVSGAERLARMLRRDA